MGVPCPYHTARTRSRSSGPRPRRTHRQSGLLAHSPKSVVCRSPTEKRGRMGVRPLRSALTYVLNKVVPQGCTFCVFGLGKVGDARAVVRAREEQKVGSVGLRVTIEVSAYSPQSRLELVGSRSPCLARMPCRGRMPMRCQQQGRSERRLRRPHEASSRNTLQRSK